MLLTLVPLALAVLAPGDESPKRPLTKVSFAQVEIDDAFWRPRLEVNRKVTLEACLAKCAETGRIRKFEEVGGVLEAARLDSIYNTTEHRGAPYDDSDVYKVLEGAAYCLRLERDPALESRIDSIVAAIASAQLDHRSPFDPIATVGEDDGYVNTYYTLAKPGERWKNIAHGHELYCGGHLIEAGVAYAEATGKTRLLEVARRFADCVDRQFGPGKRLDPCGHPEIELALMKLAQATGEERYARLAKWFIDQRGSAEGRTPFGEYHQDHAPVREQKQVVGHAVRAMYLYCGMADVAARFEDPTLIAPLESIWDDLVRTKMYVTGGIGSSAQNEGFTVPYDLPNDTAYCETCAAIGMALWNHRMFLATREAKYADLMERELFNNVLAGVSESGDRFFYDNPLASDGSKHRVPWFDCSCCPTNLVRFLPALGERVYAVDGNDVYVALYLQSTATIEVDGVPVVIRQETDYPWSGEVRFTIDPERPVTLALHLRVPAFARHRAKYSFTAGGFDGEDSVAAGGGSKSAQDAPLERGSDWLFDAGWVDVPEREFSAGAKARIAFPLVVRRIVPHKSVEANRGRVALMRGPIVYAFEGADNAAFGKSLADSIVVDREGAISVDADPNVAGGMPRLIVEEAGEEGDPATAVPYFHWDNRKPGPMAVWVRERAKE